MWLLLQYETLVKSLEDGSERSGVGNNVQVLSKAQVRYDYWVGVC